MNRKNKSYLSKVTMNYLAALLLVLCAVWNIRCESDKLEKQRQQAAFLQYIHENSKPYKQSLKQDSIFALRLDISPLSEGTIDKERIDSLKRTK